MLDFFFRFREIDQSTKLSTLNPTHYTMKYGNIVTLFFYFRDINLNPQPSSQTLNPQSSIPYHELRTQCNECVIYFFQFRDINLIPKPCTINYEIAGKKARFFFSFSRHQPIPILWTTHSTRWNTDMLYRMRDLCCPFFLIIKSFLNSYFHTRHPRS